MSINNFKIEESVGFLIGRTHRTMSNLFNKTLSENDLKLTHEQAIVLLRLLKKDGQTQQELANNIFKAKSSTTRLIDNMEKRHLVVRIPSKEDKRTKLIYLTKYGRSIQKQIMNLIFPKIQTLAKGIEEEDLKVFKKVITQIFDNANKQL